MVTSIQVTTPDQMRSIGAKLAHLLRAGDVVTLTGPLGAGKTTFTQGIGQGLDVSGYVTSPTFVVSRIHLSQGSGPALVHVDAYRLDTASDLIDLELDHLSNSIIVMEWGEPYVEHITDAWLQVTIVRDELDPQDASGGTREITFVTHGARWDSIDFGSVLNA